MASSSALAALLLATTGCSHAAPEVSNTGTKVTAEDIAAHDAELKAFAESAGLTDVPNVAVVRWVSPDEQTQTHASCLHDEGFDVTLEPDGSISADYPADQDSAYDLASYVCLAKYPVDPKYTRPLNDIQIRRVYDYDVDVLVPCLEAAGYGSDIPSWSVFHSKWIEGRPWNPANDIFANLGPDAFRDATAACEADPPLDVVYRDAGE